MRTAYRCRAYPGEQQQVLLNRTFGCVRVVWNRTLTARQAPWPGTSLAELNPTSVTVARDAAGRWFVTFHAEVPDPEPLPAAGQATGIDANRAKARRKVARAHARVTDACRDFLQKASTDLMRRFDVLAVEDLAVQNMLRNRSLARAISRTGWADFRRQLEYKAQRRGRTLVVADRWLPSSKTCSACGFVLAELSLRTRQWACLACGTRHDRDINAAKNIRAAGLAAAAASGGDACGADIRRGEATPVQSAANQESRPARAGVPVLHGGE